MTKEKQQQRSKQVTPNKSQKDMRQKQFFKNPKETQRIAKQLYMLLSMDKVKEAKKILEYLAKKGYDHPVFGILHTNVLTSEGNYQGAMKLITKYHKRYPEDRFTHYMYAETLYFSDRYEDSHNEIKTLSEALLHDHKSEEKDLRALVDSFYSFAFDSDKPTKQGLDLSLANK